MRHFRQGFPERWTLESRSRLTHSKPSVRSFGRETCMRGQKIRLSEGVWLLQTTYMASISSLEQSSKIIVKPWRSSSTATRTRQPGLPPKVDEGQYHHWILVNAVGHIFISQRAMHVLSYCKVLLSSSDACPVLEHLLLAFKDRSRKELRPQYQVIFFPRRSPRVVTPKETPPR